MHGPQLQDIIFYTARTSGYALVLIPPIDMSHKSLFRISVSEIDDEPFLIGLHEVTNHRYERFIRSDCGEDLSPERTRAAFLKGISTSSKAGQTNEYNLYFWEAEDVDDRTVFAPSKNTRNHPVVYVSLYAAEAFCA